MSTKKLSTARSREFGSGMRAAVVAAGLNARRVADLLDWDESKVSNALTGKGGISQLEVATLLGVCRVGASERNRLLALFSTRYLPGWWQQHGECLPIWPRTALVQLAAAKALIAWQPHVVPALLRTARYMRALWAASATVPSSEADERLRAQCEMQKPLNNRLNCTFYVHEFALSLQVGGRDVQAEQLHHLMLMANQKNITVRIVPAVAGAHAGTAGPFTQLRFESHKPLVWLETENSTLFVEAEDAVAGYAAVVRELDKVSLDEDASLELLVRMFVELQDAVRADAGLSTCSEYERTER